MCLIAFAYRAHPTYELVLMGNRDEFHVRPSAAAHAYADSPGVYGGRDEQAGGGWLLVHEHGRLVTVTNIRQGSPELGKRSRGHLVQELIRDPSPSTALLAHPDEALQAYGRFNLLAFDAEGLSYARNFPEVHRSALNPGVYGLSNAALDTPWPKVASARAALSAWLQRGDRDPYALLPALQNPERFPDDLLPDTGVGLEWERMLSAAFIRGEHYGTRACSLVLVGAESIRFIERNFGPNGLPIGDSDVSIPRVSA